MKKKLTLHIGHHKTGTSSIQQVLFDNKEALAADGISYFCQRPNGKSFPRAKGWLYRNRKSKQFEFKINPTFAKELGKLNGDVLVSTESFSNIYEEAKLLKFKKSLDSYFGEYEVICYIRRQDLHAISHHQQGSKKLGSPATHIYASRPRALPQYNDSLQNYLDYNKKLSAWANVFGQDAISIRIFDKTTLINGDVVTDFLSCINNKLNFDTLQKNISNSFVETKLGHMLNDKKIKLPKVRQILKANDTSGKMMPSRKEAIEFYSHFKESNKKLNERFKVTSEEFLFSDDFSSYDEIGRDTWDEQTANIAISALLDVLKNKSKRILRLEKALELASNKPKDKDPAYAENLISMRSNKEKL